METAPFRVAFEGVFFWGGRPRPALPRGAVQRAPSGCVREHLHGPTWGCRAGIPCFFWGGGAGFGAFVVRNVARHRSPMAATSPVRPWVSPPRVGTAPGGGDTPADATQPAWPWLTSGCPSWVLPSGGRLPSRNFHNGSAAGFGPESAAFRPVLVYRDFTRGVRGCCRPFGEGLLGHPPASIGQFMGWGLPGDGVGVLGRGTRWAPLPPPQELPVG